ncbi:hypothetical protein [Aquibaculum arenosum]|uniref:Uncharacterized protein n=1 Tax=Aquibaculum arenosum TaxID=3032591 RepID=A0ABT5YHW2_9PROT|nr:hypothetical protein [Fodinicurvata sp. CAU 1616]MDF2094531.1 hypothetical protein [Fodinicurvata sp. CAU 1616]
MRRVGLFLILLLIVGLIGAAAALLVVDVERPTQTVEKVVPDARMDD